VRASILVVGALLVALAGLPLGGQEPAPVSPAPATPVARRPVVVAQPVAPPPPPRGGVQAFDTPLSGALSPRNASYDIAVRLDAAAKQLQGRETIRWRNISAATTTELQFHLYWNAWRNGDSSWLREDRLAGAAPRRPQDAARRPEETGASDVTSIRVTLPDGTTADLTRQMRFLAPDDGNAADRTVMSVPLPSPVEPNASVRIDIDWIGRIPFAAARTGWIGNYYFLGQWFPKLGVLEDGGWNTHQFHRSTEFYADFGVYDVRMTVPGTFKVGASGREVRRVDNADGSTTHTYHGDDIADFAWTTSPLFIEERQTFTHPSLPAVDMRLLLLPEHRGQEARHFAATAATLERYGTWFGAYPYGNITIVDPGYQSGSRGMEYPTLFTAGSAWLAPAKVTFPDSTIIHEAGHQWWYAIVASNEFEHAWMDEGINTYATARVIEDARMPSFLAQRYFGGFLPYTLDVPLERIIDGDRLPTYRPAAEADAQTTPTFRYWPRTAGAITYDKTALWMHTLERHLGWPVLQRVMAAYFDRWKFRHPRPDDFFQVVNEVGGQDLTWFFDQVYRSSNTFDYAVQELSSESAGDGRFRTTVAAQRLGEATFPVDVVTTFADGQRVTERWDGRDRRAVYTYERASRATRVDVDPRRVLLLDVNYTNNSRTTQPRAARAGLKWALTWMVWLQELMLTSGFFA
jgi:hypothetical protein